MSATPLRDSSGTASGRIGHRAARLVDRWRAAGVIDDATAQRIRAWESQHGSADASRFGRFAFGFGGLLLGAATNPAAAGRRHALSDLRVIRARSPCP
jgi:uncharacterized membrane protein